MSALMVLENVNRVIGILFLTCYFYQLLYVPVALWRRHRVTENAPLRRYAVLISARNEEPVITQLLESIRDQDYPAELCDVWVIPNNCTDDTAGAARARGARVLECPE